MTNNQQLPSEVTDLVNNVSASFGMGSVEFEPTNNPGVFQTKTNSRQNVRFFNQKFYNPYETKRQNDERKRIDINSPTIPVWDELELVEIATPGEGKPFVGIAEDYHKQVHFKQYKAFKQGSDQSLGTPLSQAEFLAGIEIVELMAQGVRTIEQLSQASDILCNLIPRGFEIRDHSRYWLKTKETESSGEAVKKMSSDLSEALKQIALLVDKQQRSDAELASLKAKEYEREGMKAYDGPEAPAVGVTEPKPKNLRTKPKKEIIE